MLRLWRPVIPHLCCLDLLGHQSHASLSDECAVSTDRASSDTSESWKPFVYAGVSPMQQQHQPEARSKQCHAQSSSPVASGSLM